MYLGRVVGRVWSTVKNRSLEGQRFLMVQPLTPNLEKTGKRLICTDSIGAGAGETRLLGARQRGQLPLPSRRSRPPIPRSWALSIPSTWSRKRQLPQGRTSAPYEGPPRAMLIARVIGELVATQKHPSHEGRKLLLVQPLNLDGSDRGEAVIALDAVDAGWAIRCWWQPKDSAP